MEIFRFPLRFFDENKNFTTYATTTNIVLLIIWICDKSDYSEIYDCGFTDYQNLLTPLTLLMFVLEFKL